MWQLIFYFIFQSDARDIGTGTIVYRVLAVLREAQPGLQTEYTAVVCDHTGDRGPAREAAGAGEGTEVEPGDRRRADEYTVICIVVVVVVHIPRAVGRGALLVDGMRSPLPSGRVHRICASA